MTADSGVSGVQEAMQAERRRRRHFSHEFKGEVVRACQQPGMSLSGVALRYGLNANMVRKWVLRGRPDESQPAAPSNLVPVVVAPASTSGESGAAVEIETARGLVRIYGRIDPNLMRVVIESMTAR
jgi:transposase-like protein